MSASLCASHLPTARSNAAVGIYFTTARPVLCRRLRQPAIVAQAEQKPEQTGGKDVKKVSDPMSPEFKARLREEYTGLGGSPNKPMSQNYFLIISLAVAFLAILTKLTGNI